MNTDNIPKHIAIIMDGNGRWAKSKGKLRIFGHQNGVRSVRETCETCAELGVEYLTLYAFSTENWKRPKNEVDALMDLLVGTIEKETDTLVKNGIKLETIGDLLKLPQKSQMKLKKAMDETKSGNRTTLILALSYSAKWDIVQAVQNIAKNVLDKKIEINDIDEQLISQALTTKNYPNPDLLIRTSGEQRISNFLLWEVAYSEFYFTSVLWPDFRKEHLFDAILDYQKRERRYGKTSEQV